MRRPATPFSVGCLALTFAVGGSAPAPASGQSAPGYGWAAIPLLGFGVTRVNGGWNSAGAEVALEVEYGNAGWRWSGYASERGLGVGCSEACFDGGPALAVGGSRSLGMLWLGGGAGVMKQLGRWRSVPYGRVSIDLSRVRLDLRIEVPHQEGSGVYLPLLVGRPIRSGGP